MANYTFEALKNEYHDKWIGMDIIRTTVIKSEGDKVARGKDRYLVLERQTGVPWYFIGILHLRESSCNFNTHLHNGDSLKARTHNVPAGRPLKGKPPFTFEESAIDALQQKGYDKITDWSIERMAFCFEKYNGFGYRGKGIPSPYLWAGTNQYRRGKYIADHVFDPNVVDTQVGSMGVLKYLIDNYVDKIVTTEASVPEVEPEEIEQPEEEKEDIAISAPKATLPRPTTKQMNQVSRKHWWADLMQWLGFGGAGGTAAVKAADASGVPQLQEAAHTVQQIAAIVGAFGLIALLAGLAVYFMWQKAQMKTDVQEGRATPSGGEPGEV